MKRFAWILHSLTSTSLILLAVSAWPSDGWTQTCDVEQVVPKLLDNWGVQLRNSWSDDRIDPNPIVGTYGEGAVLLPTCSDGPSSGEKIKEYFAKKFLPLHPVVTFNWGALKVGGECKNPFGSGLYSFELHARGGEKLEARYTYIFQQSGDSWTIKQHHSSLQPESTSKCK